MRKQATDRNLLREGWLVRWNPDQGFGFIRPAEGGHDVFVHISTLPRGQAPELGTRLVFSAVDDPQGRGQRARKVIIVDPGTLAGTRRPHPFNALLTLAIVGATLFCLWGALTALPFTPLPLLAYPLMSIAACGAKRTGADAGARRTPTRTQ